MRALIKEDISSYLTTFFPPVTRLNGLKALFRPKHLHAGYVRVETQSKQMCYFLLKGHVKRG